MNKRHAISVLASTFALTTILGTVHARAENLTFNVKSMSASQVQIQFFSQDRRHRWPSVGRAYDLNDYGEHRYKLGCINGEKICYGAWVTGSSTRYWGVGSEGRGSCQGCCYTCSGNSTKMITLRSPVSR